MSMTWIAGADHNAFVDERPSWVKLERIDYCDQPILPKEDDWISRLKKHFHIKY